MIVRNPIQTAESHRFSVADYVRMHEIGLFPEGTRVELLDGEVLEMSPVGPLHVIVVSRLSTLIARLAEDMLVSTQNPIVLDDGSMPEPDIVVMKPEGNYKEQLPRPADIELLVEVAKSSLEYDRDEKLPRYAAVGIPECWIVDLENQTIEQYTVPSGGKYSRLETVHLAERIQSVQLPSIQFMTDLIFA